jgi:tRNA pseudouridine synthase 10
MGKRVLDDGRVCDFCGGTDRYYKESVEDLICVPMVQYFGADRAIFHAAGREDVDVRVLGTGRPFVVELEFESVLPAAKVNEKFTNLSIIEKRMNISAKNLIKIHNLSLCDRLTMVKLKQNAEFAAKSYLALVYSPIPWDPNEIPKFLETSIKKFTHTNITQGIPQRIIHRKGDRVRTKHIHSLAISFIDPAHFLLRIIAQGGTYIKELISGDDGRTTPSFAEIACRPLICAELDVIAIEDGSSVEITPASA